MRNRRVIYLAAALLLIVVLTACGADDTGIQNRSTWGSAAWDQSVWQ